MVSNKIRYAGWLGLAVIALGAIWTLPASAGPPFITDDPETPVWHGWEINFPFTLERDQEEQLMQIPLFDINYGLRPNVQLKLEFPFLWLHSTGKDEYGLGDTLVGIKWRFWEESRRLPQLGIYPQVLLPTGNSQHGLGDGKASYRIPLVAQTSWDPWTLYGNVGFVVQTRQDSLNYGYYGITLAREFNEQLELGMELFGNSATERGSRSDLAFNVGGQWKILEGLLLLFSVGHSIRGTSTTMAYLGLQILTKGWE